MSEMKKKKPIQPMQLVVPTAGAVAVLKQLSPTVRKLFRNHPQSAKAPLLYLGEIEQTPGQGVFVDTETGHLYFGYNVFDFEPIPKDRA